MKIISGRLKGRVINGYDIEGTRPTMDRVKESLFGMIQNDIKGKIVLDLFAGTGNLGFEALSNGCKFCYFNDLNKKCTKLISDNAKKFEISDNIQVLNMDYKAALEYFINNKISFDLIFLDPPYMFKELNNIIEFINDNNLLKREGIVVCEVDSLYLDIDCYQKIKFRKYGDKYIVIYKNNL